jgi:uncharacterized protein (TIGR02118 family)
VTERLVVGVWRAPRVSLDEVRDRIRGEWLAEALLVPELHDLSIALALDDQGPYAREPDAQGLVPNVDALLKIGLENAHDLDDIPARDLLHHFARRVECWRVDVRHPKVWDRTWPDGEPAPGVRMVSFVQRKPELTHQQFVRHWTEQHAPLANRHHVGMWSYTQNVVRRAYTPGGGRVDGIAELHFRTREDFDERFYDSDEGRQIIRQDVKKFIDGRSSEAALMTHIDVRSAPSSTASADG